MRSRLLTGLLCLTVAIALSVSLVHAADRGNNSVATEAQQMTQTLTGAGEGGVCNDGCEPIRRQLQLQQHHARELSMGTSGVMAQSQRRGR